MQTSKAFVLYSLRHTMLTRLGASGANDELPLPKTPKKHES